MHYFYTAVIGSHIVYASLTVCGLGRFSSALLSLNPDSDFTTPLPLFFFHSQVQVLIHVLNLLGVGVGRGWLIVLCHTVCI